MDAIVRDCPHCNARYQAGFPIFEVAPGCVIIVCAHCGIAYGCKNIVENFKVLEMFNGIESGAKQ